MFRYTTIKNKAEGIYKSKGSKFIGLVVPVLSEDIAKKEINAIKQIYHGARHHCFAYKIRIDNSELVRYNDDGEPGNTAGKPILNQIESRGLSNVLIVVVRYFGGVLLGKGGLIEAYREAAKIALANAISCEVEPTDSYTIRCSFESYNLLEEYLGNNGLKPTSKEFKDKCVIVIQIPLVNKEIILAKLSKIRNLECSKNV